MLRITCVPSYCLWCRDVCTVLVAQYIFLGISAHLAGSTNIKYRSDGRKGELTTDETIREKEVTLGMISRYHCPWNKLQVRWQCLNVMLNEKRDNTQEYGSLFRGAKRIRAEFVSHAASFSDHPAEASSRSIPLPAQVLGLTLSPGSVIHQETPVANLWDSTKDAVQESTRT